VSQELLDEIEQDCLQELVNLSYGKATAIIAKMLDAFATMRVPNISIISKDELTQRLVDAVVPNQKSYLTIQVFKGEFAGETLFFLGDASATNLVKHLKESQENESVKDVVMELTNMATSSLVREFGKLLNTEVFFEEPAIYVSDGDKLFGELEFSYDFVMLIDTVMEFKEQNIHGEVFIMMHEKTFKWLKESLMEVVKKYYS